MRAEFFTPRIQQKPRLCFGVTDAFLLVKSEHFNFKFSPWTCFSSRKTWVQSFQTELIELIVASGSISVSQKWQRSTGMEFAKCLNGCVMEWRILSEIPPSVLNIHIHFDFGEQIDKSGTNIKRTCIKVTFTISF